MSATTSIRISEALHQRLRQFAGQVELSKNKVVITAIEDYLDRNEAARLTAEARRQSQLASRVPNASDESWSQMADDSGWS